MDRAMAFLVANCAAAKTIVTLNRHSWIHGRTPHQPRPLFARREHFRLKGAAQYSVELWPCLSREPGGKKTW